MAKGGSMITEFFGTTFEFYSFFENALAKVCLCYTITKALLTSRSLNSTMSSKKSTSTTLVPGLKCFRRPTLRLYRPRSMPIWTCGHYHDANFPITIAKSRKLWDTSSDVRSSRTTHSAKWWISGKRRAPGRHSKAVRLFDERQSVLCIYLISCFVVILAWNVFCC
jgi:hypothetical protein